MIEVNKAGQSECIPHLMPFKINYEGAANISTYFHPRNNSAAFRGRRITARDVSIGDGMIGVCVKETLSESEPKQPKKSLKAKKYSMDDDDDDDDDDTQDNAYNAQSSQHSDNDDNTHSHTHPQTRQTFQSTGHTFTNFKIWMPDDHVPESTHPLCRLSEQQKLFSLINQID
ncbi:hypothetical protein E3P99_03325 [Wallemia hederae]|uniref:Uncharacterized protein n=1 Tax=Wallemia hederae TaxID=1540922 RepID=A0A4V4LSM9_9BASI|nr:hypothetical protein E3P99_03325 [Wallemia hederae]